MLPRKQVVFTIIGDITDALVIRASIGCAFFRVDLLSRAGLRGVCPAFLAPRNTASLTFSTPLLLPARHATTSLIELTTTQIDPARTHPRPRPLFSLSVSLLSPSRISRLSHRRLHTKKTQQKPHQNVSSPSITRRKG